MNDETRLHENLPISTLSTKLIQKAPPLSTDSETAQNSKQPKRQNCRMQITQHSRNYFDLFCILLILLSSFNLTSLEKLLSDSGHNERYRITQEKFQNQGKEI